MKLAGKAQTILTFTFVLASLFFSACSIRTMYNYLDWIIPFYIDDYVSLTDQQEEVFDRVTVQFLQWHRAEEMPRYERFIISFRDAQAAPMSEEQVLYLFDDAEALWTSLLQESLPSLLTISMDFNEKQLQEIDDALLADIEDLNKKYGSKSEKQRREFFRDKVHDTLKDWLGSVTDEQEEMIRTWSATRRDTTDGWLDNRRKWRLKFMELLNNRQTASYMADMSIFLLKPRNIHSSTYSKAVLENRHQFARFFADLSATFTVQQRQHLRRELYDVIGDVKQLAAAEAK